MDLFNAAATAALTRKVSDLEQAAAFNAAANSAISSRVSQLEQAAIRRAARSEVTAPPRKKAAPEKPRQRIRGTPADGTNVFWSQRVSPDGNSYPVLDAERMAAAVGRSVEYILTANTKWTHGTVEGKVRKSRQRRRGAAQ